MTKRSTPVPQKGSADGLSSLVLMLDGWLVWDGLYTPLWAGDEFRASLEFAPLTSPTTTHDAARLDHIADNRYAVVAEVLGYDDDVVALGVDDFTMLRRRHPDDAFTTAPSGSHVSLEVGLNLNPWAEEPWSRRAAAIYSADLTWRVERITLVDSGKPESVDINEASIDTVNSSEQHCLLTCTRLPLP